MHSTSEIRYDTVSEQNMDWTCHSALKQYLQPKRQNNNMQFF